MREVARFESSDGVLFLTKEKCLDYEYKVEKVKFVIEKLDSLPENDSCSFANGGGYLQHDKQVFLLVRKELLELSREDCRNHKWIQESIDDINVDSSWAGRIIGECCINTLSNAWCRISNTDKQFREWGQGYYRLNPHEGKNLQLN